MASDKLNDMLEHGLRVYEDQVDKIEGETKAKILRAQDSLNLACKEMMDDMEHARQVEKNRVS
eukprot:75892-Karenia_brevis.AAC.1